MRYLGVDYGRKRIGLALSDPGGVLAFPRGSVADVEKVAAFARAEGVGEIVIGLPRVPGQEDPEGVQRVRKFADELRKKVQLPVAFEDELFTTRIAERHTAREHADASAAALILQSYLDRQNEKSKDRG